MSTNSSISAKCKDGKYRGIYCHWDGYPSHNGRILLAHYNTPEKVEELIALGSLSSLSERAFPADGEYHSYQNPANGVTIAYERDRGEKDQKATEANTLNELLSDIGNEYDYYFDGEKWSCNDELLEEVLAKEHD